MPQRHELRDYQEKVYSWCQERSRIALFLDMRLGKCLLTLRWSQARGHKRLLIVADFSPTQGWIDECEREDLPVQLASDKDTLRLISGLGAPMGVTIVGYDRLRSSQWLLELPWDGIVLDESVKIKNPKSIISKLLVSKSIKHIGDRAILTGLPDAEGIQDYFQQMKFLYGSFMDCKSYWSFRSKFFEEVGFGWEPLPDSAWRVRKELDKIAYVLTREAAGLKEQRVPYVHHVQMPPAIKKAHDRALADLEGTLNDGRTFWGKYAMEGATFASRHAGGFDCEGELMNPYKISELQRLIKADFKGKPLVIWARFNAEIKWIAKLLVEQSGLKVGYLIGESKRAEREEVVKDFQSGRIDVIVVQGKLGKYGLKLSRANVNIYYSNHYDLDTRKQSEDRVVDVDKTEPIFDVDLVAVDSVDEDAVEALTQKWEGSKYFKRALKERIEKRRSEL